MTQPSTLPPPREPGRYRVGMVCLGNICRSPLAEAAFRGVEPEIAFERLIGDGQSVKAGDIIARISGSARFAPDDIAAPARLAADLLARAPDAVTRHFTGPPA